MFSLGHRARQLSSFWLKDQDDEWLLEEIEILSAEMIRWEYHRSIPEAVFWFYLRLLTTELRSRGYDL